MGRADGGSLAREFRTGLWFEADGQFSALGHRLSAQVVIKYLDSMVKETSWWAFRLHANIDVPSVRCWPSRRADARTS